MAQHFPGFDHLHGYFSRDLPAHKEALGLSSLVVDLSLTQVVGVRGVHAFLAHDALRLP